MWTRSPRSKPPTGRDAHGRGRPSNLFLRAGADQLAQLLPERVEVDGVAAVAEQDDRVVVGEIVVIRGVEAAPIAVVAEAVHRCVVVAVELPAQAIAFVPARPRERELHRRGLEQLVAADGGVPPGHVFQVAPDGAIPDLEVLLLAVPGRKAPTCNPALVLELVADGVVARRRGVLWNAVGARIDERVLHSSGNEYVIAQNLAERLLADALDDEPQQHVVGVVVFVFLPDRKIERRLAQRRKVVAVDPIRLVAPGDGR